MAPWAISSEYETRETCTHVNVAQHTWMCMHAYMCVCVKFNNFKSNWSKIWVIQLMLTYNFFHDFLIIALGWQLWSLKHLGGWGLRSWWRLLPGRGPTWLRASIAGVAASAASRGSIGGHFSLQWITYSLSRMMTWRLARGPLLACPW